jgi:hypothetical protein
VPTSSGDTSELAVTTSSSTLKLINRLKTNSHLAIGEIVTCDDVLLLLLLMNVALRNLSMLPPDVVDVDDDVVAPVVDASTFSMT